MSMSPTEAEGPTRTAHAGRAPTLPGGGTSALPAPDLPALDPHRLVLGHRHARGGLGEILRADDRLLGREVAVKRLLRPDDGAASARFLREAVVTARLQHPGIVPIYDVGRLPSGAPYYAMKMVSGRPLREVIAEARTVDERLALVPHVIAVADAIAYAHRRGFIHRDLKPSNVMVGHFGETVVIDWGLARELRAGAGDEPTSRAASRDTAIETPDVTHTGDVLGTPAYMAPEQASGLDVDERADVYAIGAILYHMLCGERPYTGDTSDQVMARVIAGPPAPLGGREPDAPPDLLAIVDKAMARDRRRRYADAAALVGDLRRFQTGQLVGARRYSRWELVRRWFGRHRAPVLIASALTVALLVTAAIGATGVVAESRRVRSANNDLRLLHARSELGRDPTAAVAWLGRYRAGDGDLPAVVDIAARAAVEGVARDVYTMPGRAALVTCLSPDARHLVAGDRDGILWLWDTRERTRRELGAHDFRPSRCSFTRDGRFVISTTHRGGSLIAAVPDGGAEPLPGPDSIATYNPVPGVAALVAADRDQTIHWIDLDTGDSRPIARVPQRVTWLAAAPGGDRVAVAGLEGGVFLVDVATGALTELPGHTAIVTTISFSADGNRLLTGAADTVAIHDLATGVVTRAGQPGRDSAVVIASFARDGVVMYDSETLSLRRWRPALGTFELLGEEVTHEAPLITDDGARVVWTSLDGTVYAHDLDTGYRWQLPGHRGSVRRVSVTPDGRFLASAAADETVRVWQLPARSPRVLDVAVEQFGAVSIGPERVVTADRDGVVRLWNTTTGESRELGRLGDTAAALAASRDGARVVATSVAGAGRVWDLSANRTWEIPMLDGPASYATVTDDGAIYVSDDRVTRAWRVPTDGGDALLELARHDTGGIVTRSGRYAYRHGFGGIRIADLISGVTHEIPTPGGIVFAFDVAPDGDHFAAGTADGLIRTIDGRTGEARELARMEALVDSLAYAPDGRTLVAGDETGALVVIDVASGQARSLPGHDSNITSMGFSADGTLIATADTRGHLRVWRIADGAMAVLPAHATRVFDVVFVPGGPLLTLSADGEARAWTVPGELIPAARDELRAWIAGVTTARVGDDGALVTEVAARD